MSLVTPPSVQKLQMALHAKAKEESPDFRFYALYDKGCRKDVLEFVYERCKVSQWLSTKHKVQWPAVQRFPAESLYDVFGLACLSKRATLVFRGRKRESFPRAGCGGSACSVRFLHAVSNSAQQCRRQLSECG